MAITAAQLLADQAFLFGDFPTETITIDGVNYPCLVPRAVNANDWKAGGLDDMPKVTVLINRNVLATAPQQGTAVEFRGVGWRLGIVRRDYPQAPLMLELEDDESGITAIAAGSGGMIVTGAGRRIVRG